VFLFSHRETRAANFCAPCSSSSSTEENKSKKAHYKLPECPESSFARPDNSFARYLFGPLAPLLRENETAAASDRTHPKLTERRRREFSCRACSSKAYSQIYGAFSFPPKPNQ